MAEAGASRPEVEVGPEPPEVEIPLDGGLGSDGLVVRVGDTVRRPTRPSTTTVHAYLDHLRAHGLAGVVPEPLGSDGSGREVLSFLPGSPFGHPYPTTLASDELLVAVAQLQARLHSASVGFEAPPDASWTAEPYFPASAAGDLVCHNDLCVQNVLFAGTDPVGVIDFDYAHPVDPLFDIVVAARHWVPLRPRVLIDDARRDTDPRRRFRAFASVHGLDAEARRAALEVLIDALPVWLANIRSQARSGHGGFARMLDDGYEAQNTATRAWLASEAAHIAG